ncbi:hypothetical protein IFM89_006964 [Coptis chinensis]|uniref:Bet v I/Major latex protein domain-containing protein n=1 Tax=Coptis chinensis TaxID=261450 RepID=A0A835HCX7_9MAGN|nr:hypothetical protein IFM89_006964 [Coptis chinensis]
MENFNPNIYHGTTEILEGKEKTEVIDDENMLIVLDICEGDHTDHYARFVEKIQVIPKGEGSLVKVTLEYEKAKEGVSDPHHYMDLFAKITDKLEAHLIAKA